MGPSKILNEGRSRFFFFSKKLRFQGWCAAFTRPFFLSLCVSFGVQYNFLNLAACASPVTFYDCKSWQQVEVASQAFHQRDVQRTWTIMTKGEEEKLAVCYCRLERQKETAACSSSRRRTKLLIHLSSILKFKIRAFQIFLQLFPSVLLLLPTSAIRQQ